MNTSIIEKYLEENEGYIDEDSATALSSLPDSAWEALTEGSYEVSRDTDPGVDNNVALTHDTLADFDRARSGKWSDGGSRDEVKCGGCKAVLYEKFQLFPGQRRRNMVVIDLGEIRVALSN